MKKKKKIPHRSDCPISTALDVFGDKWTLLIIRDMLFEGKTTYGDFLGSGEKIATNILADRLMLLESAGLISRNKHPHNKLKVLYRLTPKGKDLMPVLLEIMVWSDRYYDIHPQARSMIRQIRPSSNHPTPPPQKSI